MLAAVFLRLRRRERRLPRDRGPGLVTEQRAPELDKREQTSTSAAEAEDASAAVLQPPAPALAPTRTPKKDADPPSAKSKRGRGKRASAGKKQALAPALKPAPAPTYDGPRDKQTLRDELASADRLRRAGKCAAAQVGYNALINVGGLEQGRALAGLGLCAEARGELDRAGHFFARARQAYGAIDGWIAAERERDIRMLGKD